MSTYLYTAMVFTRTHGECLGSIVTFDIDQFNGCFIVNYEDKYYCRASEKTKVNFGNLTKEDVCDILNNYDIYPLEATITNFKETLDNIYKEYPQFTRYKDEDFELVDKNVFLSTLKKTSVSFGCVGVEVGVKHPIKD